MQKLNFFVTNNLKDYANNKKIFLKGYNEKKRTLLFYQCNLT